MPRVVKTVTVPALGVGRPDYTKDVARGISTAGYAPKDEEAIHYLAYIALSDAPGGIPFTKGGIAPGEEVKLIDAATGKDYFLTEAGYDCIVKDMWISFTQKTRWRMYSYYHSDYCCQAFFEANCKPLNVYPFGYVKTGMVPLGEDWKMEGRVKNLGTEMAYGKAWLTILKKKGAFTWR